MKKVVLSIDEMTCSACSNGLEKYLNKHYKGLLRSTYYQPNSTFYQDYDSNMFLVELGGPDNTLEEIYNSAVALSKAIKYYVDENK